MVIKAKNAPSDERKPNKRFFREMCSVLAEQQARK